MSDARQRPTIVSTFRNSSSTQRDDSRTTDSAAAVARACTRRDLLRIGIGCGAYALLAWSALDATGRRAFAATPRGRVIRTEPFARVEQLSDGVWAIISTPMQSSDWTTVSNGGIVAGRDGVMVIEGFNSVAGGAWARKLARELTGRPVTHVVMTHFHGDHSNGLAGFLDGEREVALIASAGSRSLHAWQHRTAGARQGRSIDGNLLALGSPAVLPNIVVPDGESAEIDLGGRKVRLRGRVGHTPSDLTVEIDDPRVLWAGDLVFRGLFPNYGDAIPSRLGETCRAMLADPDTTYVPGHGAVSGAEELKPYLELLEEVEQAARRMRADGKTPDEVWESYELPPSLGEWAKYRPDVYRFAFEAWERELSDTPKRYD